MPSAAADLQEQNDNLLLEGKFADAVFANEELLKLRTAAQGVDHWQTTNARLAVEFARRLADLPPDEQARWQTVIRDMVNAARGTAKGEFAAALPLVAPISRTV